MTASNPQPQYPNVQDDPNVVAYRWVNLNVNSNGTVGGIHPPSDRWEPGKKANEYGVKEMAEKAGVSTGAIVREKLDSRELICFDTYIPYRKATKDKKERKPSILQKVLVSTGSNGNSRNGNSW